jgi:hypothetical protein
MTTTNVNVPLPGYPQPFGSKIVEIFDHYGPTSYVQYGSAVGDIINASDLSVGGFDFIGHAGWNSYSNSGNYIVQVMMAKANDIPAGGPASRVTIQWFTVSGGAFGTKSTEATAATNLSAEYVRLEAIMV